MKFRNLVVAAAGVCLLALTSFAQITAIEGDVKGEDGTPTVNAVVKILRTDIKGSYKCNTNKKGHYFYNGLPLGTYNITVEIGGKEMDGVNGVRTKLGDPTPINFDLQKIAQQRSAKNAQMQAAAAGTAPALSKEQERGMTKEQKEAYDKAIKDREASMKKNKELNDAFTAGLAAMQSKDYDAAVTNLTKASELDPPKAGQYYYNLGAMLGNAGQSEPAGQAFKKAIELDPKHADSYYQLGVYLIGKASFAADGKVTPVPGTVDAFQKYLELAPTGQFADSAKGMLASMDAKVDTSYKNPNATPPKKKK